MRKRDDGRRVGPAKYFTEEEMAQIGFRLDHRGWMVPVDSGKPLRAGPAVRLSGGCTLIKLIR